MNTNKKAVLVKKKVALKLARSPSPLFYIIILIIIHAGKNLSDLFQKKALQIIATTIQNDEFRPYTYYIFYALEVLI